MAELAPVEPAYQPGEDADEARQLWLEAAAERCLCLDGPCLGVTLGGECERGGQ